MPETITIEFTAPSMGFIVFNPTMQNFRSRWDPQQLPPGTTFAQGSKAQAAMVPGEYFELDINGRKARGYDPLGDESYKPLLAKIAKPGHTFIARETTHFKNLTDDDIATYLHWMQRFVRNGNAQLVPGSAPFPAKAPNGRILVDPFNSSQVDGTPRYLDEFQPKAKAVVGAAT